MKKFILGFITGGIIAAAVTGFAVEYAITANPYPVKVNGVETAIEGYNINDSTFFKLRDVADAVGGFSVDFKDNAIILDTAAAPEPTPTPIPTAKNNLEPLPEVEVETVDGKEYVRKYNIEKMLKDIGLGDYLFSTTKFIKFYGEEPPFPVILDNVPQCPTDSLLIPYSYYQSTIIPAINNLR